MRIKIRHVTAGAIPVWFTLSFFAAQPLLAIPSPDLVVNFFASTAQVLGLVSVVAGGILRVRRRRHGQRASPWPFRISLGLFFVTLAGFLLFYSRTVDEKNQRLRTNLVRTSRENGVRVGDTSLVTLSLSKQVEHPLGISTETLLEWLQSGRPVNLVDIREPEEVEMGRIPGSWHRRYPDLRRNRDGLLREGTTTVLLCFSGNRSSELADEFAAEKVRCRFLIGGYEKWIAEGREMDIAQGRTYENLREIPYYPTRDTLLDTPDVHRILEAGEVVFIDVRYPKEFDQGSLPGAKNITIRSMPTGELYARLRALPRRPIIVPCYDKRSSFYGKILGLRLHRLGFDFRGRYTVPHEFFVPSGEREYVKEWRERQESRTLLAIASVPLEGLLRALEENSGNLAAAIIMVVALLRLGLFPFMLKGERDQLRLRQLAADVKRIKSKYDRRRASQAILRLHKKEKLTPVRNLICTTIQIAVFIMFFSVVQRVAAGSDQGFAWVPLLGAPDPLYILPVVTGVCVFVHLYRNAAQRTPLRVLLHLSLAALLVAITLQLSGAVNLYLAFSLLLLTLQSEVVRRLYGERRQSRRRGSNKYATLGMVPLRHAESTGGAGNKASRLAAMLNAGLPVPDGFVVTSHGLIWDSDKETGLQLTYQQRRKLRKLWNQLHADKVAVRSSGLNEDGAEQSYAGVFESILNVTWDRLLCALGEVKKSLSSTRAESYGGRECEEGGIVVQKMVPARFAGVLFTEHPASSGSMLVELVSGLGEALVSGNTTPKAYRVGRSSGQPLDSQAPPVDLAPLVKLGWKVEALFGSPQDIEWAYANGRFFLLQARDITASPRRGSDARATFERERWRILESFEKGLAGEPVLLQDEVAELLPRPTPLSLALMESLWGANGSTDLACEELGVPYSVGDDSPPLFASVFGKLYVNRLEQQRRTSKGLGPMAAFRLSKAADSLEREFREDFLPEYLAEMRLREALELSSLTRHELVALFARWYDEFVGKIYVQAELINVAADFYFKSASKDLEKKGLDPAVHLGQLPETVVRRAMAALANGSDEERGIQHFLDQFGHRAPQDYELSQPRYRESIDLVREMVQRSVASNGGAQHAAAPAIRDRLLALNVHRARRFQVLKEEAKHHALRALASLRSILVELDSRMELDDGIFYLLPEEIRRLDQSDFLDLAIERIDRRRKESETLVKVRLPAELSIFDLEKLEWDSENEGQSMKSGSMRSGSVRGTRVSGDRPAVGRVRVVADEDDIGEFQDGEILVARFTDPTWTPLFPRAAGIVTEVGGWLSHAAIVAREYNVPAVVGAGGAMQSLSSGELVRLTADGVVELVETDRRRHERVSVCTRIALVRQGRAIEAIVKNLSRSGALIHADEDFEAGQGVRVRLQEHGPDLLAKIVRKSSDGGYAVQFQSLISHPAKAGDRRGPERN